jgi:hypothetical protein
MSGAIYRMLVRLGPVELRRWELEMADVLAMQLADARHEHGRIGVLAVWWRAVAEMIGLMLAGPSVVIPVVSVASTGAIFAGLTWALENSLAMLHAYRHVADKLCG